MIVYSTVYSGADQRKYQISASLAFVRGIHRWPANSPHKKPVTRKMFPFDDVFMKEILPMMPYAVCICHWRGPTKLDETKLGTVKSDFKGNHNPFQWRFIGVKASTFTGHSTVYSEAKIQGTIKALQYLCSHSLSHGWIPHKGLEAKRNKFRCIGHTVNIRVTEAISRLNSPATLLFVYLLAQTNSNWTSKLTIMGPMWREASDERWIHIKKGQ